MNDSIEERLEALYNDAITTLNSDDDTKDQALVLFEDYQVLREIIKKYYIITTGLSEFKKLFLLV